MLLQQLTSILLCSQFPSPADVQQTLGLHCTKDRCREFLKCQVRSDSTCSCFLHKEMKTFACPKWHFVVSESGNSDLHEAARFCCKFQPVDVSLYLSPPTSHLTSLIIIGSLNGRLATVSLNNGVCGLCPLRIIFKPKKKIKINGGKHGTVVAKTFPFKVMTNFEMKMLFRQNEYEVRVDGEIICSGTPLPDCKLEHMTALELTNVHEIQSLHINYNE